VIRFNVFMSLVIQFRWDCCWLERDVQYNDSGENLKPLGPSSGTQDAYRVVILSGADALPFRRAFAAGARGGERLAVRLELIY
jgi:hypothetical protein